MIINNCSVSVYDLGKNTSGKIMALCTAEVYEDGDVEYDTSYVLTDESIYRLFKKGDAENGLIGEYVWKNADTIFTKMHDSVREMVEYAIGTTNALGDDMDIPCEYLKYLIEINILNIENEIKYIKDGDKKLGMEMKANANG